MGGQATQDTKKCRVCKCLKPLNSMVKSKAFSCGVDTICLECSRERVKEWKKTNPDKRKEQLKREQKQPYSKNKQLRTLYGITYTDYNQMFFNQQGCCKICKKHQSEFSKKLCVDHCHVTGKIRGLLCSTCNTLLGMAKDSTVILQSALEYIKDNNEPV